MDLGALAARLGRIRLVDAERDLIERLDRLAVASGGLRYAATSAPTIEAASRLVSKLARAAPELEHELRVVADDRPELIRAHPDQIGGRAHLVAGAIALVPAPLPLAFSWRRGHPRPPKNIRRTKIGPLLGYPRCCVRFEEARRAEIVQAEARGMIETWEPTSVEELVVAISERRPFLADEVDEEGRLARLRRFPFVSFVPCPRCCERDESPAGREDARRRALLRGVSKKLAEKIERVRGSTGHR